MSSLDQAFIRAYQAGRSAAKSRSATPEPGTAAAVSTSEQATSGVAPSRSDAQQNHLRTAVPTQVTDRRTRHYVDVPHPAAYGPHYAEEAAASQVSVEPSEVVVDATSSAIEAFDRSSTALLPETTGVVESAIGLHPAYETQCFAWPKNVEVLIAAAGSEFSRFTTELSQRSAAGRKTLVVTGVDRAEGRTTLVLALARLAANRNLRTAVVDVDLRAPQLAEQLGLRAELGWDDVVAERLQISEALVESMDDRITLLPLRSPLANPRVMAGNTSMAEMIEQLREHYDVVLLDVGPLADDEQAIDAAAVLTGCALDDALVVRDRRRTNPKQVQGVCRRLAALGVRHWDIVENFTEVQGY